MSTDSGGGFFDKIKRILGIGASPQDDYVEERRTANRMAMRIPVQLRRPGQSWEGHTVNLSPGGLLVCTDAAPTEGSQIDIAFDGVVGASDVVVSCRVVYLTDNPQPGLGLQIDRQGTGREGCSAYRQLVMHYRKHPPLLEERRKGIHEARCAKCNWMGRVAGTQPTCPRCGTKDMRLIGA